jgi:hypothetical protein
MPTNSPIQSLPVPVAADPVNIPGDLLALAQAVENRTFMRFTSVSDRNAKVPAPQNGMVCCLTDTNSFQVYSDGSWRTFYTGNAPGSSASYGHIFSYQGDTRPSGARPGTLSINRDNQMATTMDNAGAWRGLAAYTPTASVSYRYGGSGLTTTPGNVSNCCSLVITTTVANTRVLINAMSVYSLLGVGFFLNMYGGFQQSAAILLTTPPGGTLTEIKRITKRDMNTGGDGSSQVGGPTPQTNALQHVYNCVTPGEYPFTLRLQCGTSGNGNIANFGGDMTIQPIVETTTF